MAPKVKAMPGFKGAASAASSSPNATKPPACRSMSASERPVLSAPRRMCAKWASACSGVNEVPSQPSAAAPVYSKALGARVAR